jgi:hypothetical protein
MYRQPPQARATLTTTSGVIYALPASLRERGIKLMHLLQTFMEWNEQGKIVNRYTGTHIPGSNVVNAIRHLLGEKDVDDPAEHYVSEVVCDTHILPAAGEGDRETPPPPIVTKTSPKTVKTPPKTAKTHQKTAKTSPKTVKAQEKKTPEPFPQTEVAWLML